MPFNIVGLRFEVWLSGSNKAVQGEYIQLLSLKPSNKYTLSQVLPGVDSIIESVIVEHPDFDHQEELKREKAAQKESGQQSGEATFCLIEEAVNLENEMIDEWIVFRWKRVYPADVFLKFPADGWEKELIETFAGYSHEEIDLERYRKKDRAKF